MAGFGSSGRFGFGDGGDKEKLVGKIEDIKSAPDYGERRVMVREKSGSRASVAIDIPTKYTGDLERKETYTFTVEEKNAVRSGQGSRMKTSSFRSYHCEEKPLEYGSGGSRDDLLNRFGDSERGGGTDRSKRKFFT